MKITYNTGDTGKVYIRDKVLELKKQNPNFRIIDIGGTSVGWTSDFVDLVVDIMAPDSDEKSMRFDICRDNQWSHVLELVDQLGKFDYCICTHTLEDIYNPITPLDMMPKIAKAGVITMPSARKELSICEHESWLGFIHHRWLFDQEDGQMLIAPKLNFLQNFRLEADPTADQIQYEWENEIPYKMFMDNYLGPNMYAVVDKYKELISKL